MQNGYIHLGLLGSNQPGILNQSADIVLIKKGENAFDESVSFHELQDSLSPHLKKILTIWQAQGIHASGLFHTIFLDHAGCQALDQYFRKTCKDAGIKRLTNDMPVHLQIKLHTQGRIDTQAWSYQQTRLIQVPLELSEDEKPSP